MNQNTPGDLAAFLLMLLFLKVALGALGIL